MSVVRFVVAAVTEHRDWVAGTVSSLGGWAAQGQGSRSLVYGQGPLSKWQAAALGGGRGERERPLYCFFCKGTSLIGPHPRGPFWAQLRPKGSSPMSWHWGTGLRHGSLGEKQMFSA